MDNYTTDEEIWKDVQEFKGVLQISSKGRVRTLDRVCKGKNNSNQIRNCCEYTCNIIW